LVNFGNLNHVRPLVKAIRLNLLCFVDTELLLVVDAEMVAVFESNEELSLVEVDASERRVLCDLSFRIGLHQFRKPFVEVT